LHYTEHTSFTQAFIGFSQVCRSHELNVGIHENQQALIAATEGLWGEYMPFKYAMTAIYCTRQDELERFDKLFEDYWGMKKELRKSETKYRNKSNLKKKNKGSAVMMGLDRDNAQDDDNEARNTSGATDNDALRKTDFAHVEQMQNDILEELAEQLWKQMSLRLKRKTKVGKKGKINIQQTIRRNLSNGGNMLELIRRKKKMQKYRLVILLDVSGSMDKYSFYLLKFVHSLRANFENVEAFIFSTELVRITDFLNKKSISETLSMLSLNTQTWSSGTKIGDCLKTFNDEHSKRVLNGKTLTIVLSDGLDTGEPDDLHIQLEKIKLRTKKLVWLNPLKGMEGYQPIQRGMEAALPTLDHFGAAHNIDSLLALENILIDA